MCSALPPMSIQPDHLTFSLSEKFVTFQMDVLHVLIHSRPCVTHCARCLVRGQWVDLYFDLITALAHVLFTFDFKMSTLT